MANPFSKGWKYLMSSFDQKIDEHADPKVQIQQAVSAAKAQHQDISEQAASIIGNKKQLEVKLDRLVKSQAEYQEKARTALQMADKASTEGDSAKAAEYTNTAEVIASQLVTVESELENTKQMHAQATQAAEQAQQQVKQSEARLNEQLSEVDKLMNQADQAKMQETNAQAMDSINQFGGDDNVPTLDGVRDKIERRYADALGAQELTQSTVTDRMAEISNNGSDFAAASKLDEIRASMKSGSDKELEAGADTPAEANSGAPSTGEEPVDAETEAETGAEPGVDETPTNQNK